MLPTGTPAEKMERAVARRSGGKVSEMREWAGAPPAASPTPTKTRVTASWVAVRARPDAAVNRLQTTRPSAMIERRDPTSAQRAIGMPHRV
jgi:hypothetical protein